MKCPVCGTEYEGNFCPRGCNAPQQPQQPTPPPPVYQQPTPIPQPTVVVNNYTNMVSSKSWIAALLLCIFLGGIGIHRFYVGKVGTGILYLLTGGLCGIGVLVDLIQIACGNFKDNMGLLIKNK